MIVKIQRYEKDQDFWMIDGIKKISCSGYLLTRIEHHRIQDDVSILDYYNFNMREKCTCVGEKNECADCPACKRLICRDEDNNEFSILFDTIVYILNDNGKTVEKIVANYKD